MHPEAVFSVFFKGNKYGTSRLQQVSPTPTVRSACKPVPLKSQRERRGCACWPTESQHSFIHSFSLSWLGSLLDMDNCAKMKSEKKDNMFRVQVPGSSTAFYKSKLQGWHCGTAG